MSETILANLVEMSRYLGAPERGYAILGEGNSSARIDEETFWVKASGTTMARIDAGGRLYIVGRSKLLIDCLGYKIDPIEVEQALEEHAQVREAAVIGVPGPNGKGQRLKAIVVPSGNPLTPAMLIDFLRARLSAQKVPSQIVFTQSLPKSPTGKLLRRLLPSMD